MSSPATDTARIVEDIAAQLGETNPVAIEQIGRIVRQLGRERAYDFLRKALEVEAKGGVLTWDKTRRRSPGGTFFFLVRGRISPAQHTAIWPHLTHPYARKESSKGKKGDKSG